MAVNESLGSGSLPKLSFSGYVLDLSSRTLERGGQSLRLRRKVFDVLAYLAVNRQRAVTKDELIREVWQGASVSDDVVTGAITSIRTALGDTPTTQGFIRTAHGYGYQFVAPVEPLVEASREEPPAPRWPRVAGWALSVVVGGAVLIMGGARLVRMARDSGTAEPIPAERLWLRFEDLTGDVALDSSTYGNNALVRGGVRRVPGVLGSAVEFDGVTGYLEGVSSGTAFPQGDSPRTVICWVRTTDRSEGDRNILHWGTPTDAPPRLNFHLFLSVGRVGWGNGYAQGYVRTVHDLANGNWRQVAGVYTGAPAHAAYVYIDGKQAADSMEPLRADTRLAGKWMIGVFMEGGTPFRGALDDLRVFSTALSASTILALRNCSLPEPAFQAPYAGRPYFVPIGNSELYLGEKDARESSIPIENSKEFFGVAEFGSSDGRCACTGLRGVPLPVSVRIAMDIESPLNGREGENLAGPFLDAVPLGPFDRTSELSGVWVALNGLGSVSLRQLSERDRVIASSAPRAGFDSGKAHRLEVERRPGALRVLLDGSSALTLGSLPTSRNLAAGIAFQVGRRPLSNLPQRVRNLSIERL